MPLRSALFGVACGLALHFGTLHVPYAVSNVAMPVVMASFALAVVGWCYRSERQLRRHKQKLREILVGLQRMRATQNQRERGRWQ